MPPAERRVAGGGGRRRRVGGGRGGVGSLTAREHWGSAQREPSQIVLRPRSSVNDAFCRPRPRRLRFGGTRPAACTTRGAEVPPPRCWDGRRADAARTSRTGARETTNRPLTAGRGRSVVREERFAAQQGAERCGQ